jgi:hypothetical protein
MIMGIKFEDLSPIAGVMSGKGVMGELARSGMMGIAPAAISRNAYDKAEEERVARESAAKQMKKGGKVSSASKRADGIAQRGKTRGRIV